MKQEHKDYITKNNINSVEELKKHLQHLSDYRHALTKDGEQMFRELSCMLYEDRESVLSFFAAINKSEYCLQKALNQIGVTKETTQKSSSVWMSTEDLKKALDKKIEDSVVYTFSWRPSQKTESTLNTKPVHSNPWVNDSYFPRKKRLKDVEKEKEVLNTWLVENNQPIKYTWYKHSFDSPLAPKQKDKITTDDLKVYKPKEVNCQYTMCGDKNCVCCYPDKPSELFKKPEVKDCVIKDSKVIIDEIIFGGDKYENVGIKESQTVKKAPIFTYCKQMKNALEQLAFRSEYGHNKYLEYDADYNNFARVPNGDEEYGNAMFRHALNIGEDSELDHYVAQAWDAVARLEIYLRNEKLKNS